MKNLNAVLLEEVFPYLRQKDRLEAMVVSKEWEKVVMEGKALWRHVTMGRQWELRHRARKRGPNARMFRLASPSPPDSSTTRDTSLLSYPRSAQT